LAYGSLRTARRRLARLVELGLVRGFWAANNQRPRGRYAYELTRSVRQELERIPESGRHRRTPERPAKGTIHELATNDLLGAFLRNADPERGVGLAAWLPERAVAPLFDGYVRPDALAVVGTPSSRISLLIERDLGTEGSKVVAAKAAKYATLFGGPPSPINVGIVVETAARSAVIRHAIGGVGFHGPHIWVTTSAELVGAPLPRGLGRRTTAGAGRSTSRRRLWPASPSLAPSASSIRTALTSSSLRPSSPCSRFVGS
jgi:hypothetical protein